jgi:[ribosomal protein S5]-alanine N-acetyltransferase
MPLHTRRLTLRSFTTGDFASLRELDSDPSVLRYRSRKHISEEMTRGFLERAQHSIVEQPRLYYAYALEPRRGGPWLGQCGLTILVPDMVEAFVWYSMLPRYWGQGYMAEAVRALFVLGFGELGLETIIAECHPENRASLRVMQKAAMKGQGIVDFADDDGSVTQRIRYAAGAECLSASVRDDVLLERPW